MMGIKLWQIVFVSFISPYGSLVSGSPVELLRDLEMSAKYHLQSFKRNLDEIRALQDQITTSVEARSVDDDLRWDLYLSPMLAFCEDLKHLNVELKTTTSASPTVSPHRDKDGFVLGTRQFETDGKESEWYLPAVRPIKVQAERDGTKVRLMFDVIHSSPAYAVRIESFQYAKAELEVPAGAKGKFLSRVQFVTNASACRSGKFDFRETYQFFPRDLEEGGSFMGIDTCGFDKYQNMSLEFEDRTWLTRNGTIDEMPSYPTFRIVSRTNSNIVVRRGRNTPIDIDVRLGSTTVFYAFGSFYDYDLRIPLKDSAGLRLDWEGNPVIDRSKKNRIRLIKVKVLKFVTSKNKTGVENPDKSTIATIRITVSTKGTSLGGNLVFRSFSYRNDYYDRAIIDTVGIDRVFRFKQPGERYPPPDLDPLVISRNITVCTEEGNSYLPREGPNCTLSCNAFGPNISSISITKIDSKLMPYRSISYVLNDTAFAKIDVGRASPENEGSYLCVVENNNGRVENSLKLYTSGLPNIIHEESTLRQFDNDTSEVTCKAMGAQPLKMKMNIKREGGTFARIDKDSNYSRTLQRLDKGIVLKLRLPTKELQFPNYILSCVASNDRGSDMKQYFLYNDVKDYYEPVVPKLDEGSTRITSFENGTTAITCKASGAFPLDVMVLYGGRSEYFRIDNYPSNTKLQKSTSQSKTATLLVNTKSIKGRTSWLHCFAKNEYGSDILDYDLDDYI